MVRVPGASTMVLREFSQIEACCGWMRRRTFLEALALNHGQSGLGRRTRCLLGFCVPAVTALGSRHSRGCGTGLHRRSECRLNSGYRWRGPARLVQELVRANAAVIIASAAPAAGQKRCDPPLPYLLSPIQSRWGWSRAWRDPAAYDRLAETSADLAGKRLNCSANSSPI